MSIKNLVERLDAESTLQHHTVEVGFTAFFFLCVFTVSTTLPTSFTNQTVGMELALLFKLLAVLLYSTHTAFASMALLQSKHICHIEIDFSDVLLYYVMRYLYFFTWIQIFIYGGPTPACLLAATQGAIIFTSRSLDCKLFDKDVSFLHAFLI